MTCPRCAGLMVVDEGIDLVTGFWCDGVRCLNCGNWVDAGVRANRQAPVAAIDGRRLPRQVKTGLYTYNF